ncbi:MAG: endonuclease/exonuclease/phosphatase family protein, partial [Candidatus Thiodiazotropha sp.]
MTTIRKDIQKNVSICVWNIGGLSNKSYNKLQDPQFIRKINYYDIILLTETHIGNGEKISLSGYSFFSICRRKSSNNRYFGGLGILIKNSIRPGVKLQTNTSSEYQWIALKKDFFHIEKDIYLCLAYIAPSTSGHQTDPTQDGLEAIERDINKFRNMGYIALCGDFNARTGSERDFIVDDSDRHLPLDINYIEDTHIPLRRSEDMKVDERGKRLLDICISARLRILNGRTTGDLNGKYTCHKPTGSSVVDYFITSEELFTDVLYFHVDPFHGTFSDCHCKMSATLILPHSPVISVQKLQEASQQFRWNKTSKHQFRRALQLPAAKLGLQDIIDRKAAETEQEIDNVVEKLENIIINAANISLKVKTRNAKLKHKQWFDQELYLKRRELFQKGKIMSDKPYDRGIRNSYFKTYREYTKLRKYKKKHLKQTILNKLDALEKEDPKSYWRLVNSLKDEESSTPESSINSETWSDYFSNLNSLDPKHLERSNAIKNMVQHLEQKNRTFSEIDVKITEREIIDAISSLKMNKAPGLDRISNEMIEASSDILVQNLHKIFNNIFTSGKYPKQWASGYI